MNGKNVWAHEKFCVHNDIVWFVPYYNCILCAYNLATKKLTIEAILKENINDTDIYINIAIINSKLLLIPSYGNDLCIYDFVNKIINYYSLENHCRGTKFLQYANVDNKIYILPYDENRIIKIIVDEKNELQIDYIKTEFNKILSCCSIGETIYFVRNDNTLYEYNVNSGVIKHDFEKISGFIDICQCEDNNLFLLGSEGYIYKYDISEEHLDKIIEGKDCYHSISIASSFLYAFPEKNGTYFDIFNLLNGEKKRITLGKEKTNISWKANAFSKSFNVGSKVYVMNLMLEMLLEIDSKTGNIVNHYIDISSISKEEKKSLLEKEIKDGYIIENRYLGADLSQFLKMIK